MSKSESGKGEVIQPLPIKGEITNLDKAIYHIRIAEAKEKRDRTRSVAKALYFLHNELKEIASNG